MNSMLKTIYQRLGIHQITTTPYHPQADGMVEHFNGTLKSILRRSLFTFNDQWDVLGKYRSTPCRATGFTPAELVLGKNIRTPLAVLKEQWQWTSEMGETGRSLGRYVTDLMEGIEKMRELAKENQKV